MARKAKKPTPPKGTAVIYARFSSSKQREASIDDQLRICRRWCADRDVTVVAEYCDRAASGRTDDRPEFQRMISNAGEAETVLVYMMDRFSRDVYDAPIYKKKLRDAGVSVVSATENLPDGPEAILMESIVEAMAAMESAHTSQRTKRGMEGNAMKCMHNGVYMYGYDLGDDGYYHVNEGQAENVRRAFALRASGRSIRQVAEWLDSVGARTYKGNPCTYGMVAGMLGNEKYKGTYVWGDVRVEGGMPAILTAEEFMAAQNVRASKVRNLENWTRYAFAGKGVCGECGSNLVGVSGRGRHDVKYVYYRCSNRCGCKPVRADWLESEVADRLRRMVRDPKTAREVTDAVARYASGPDDGKALEAARERLSGAERAMSNLMRAVEDGMPYANVRDRYEELDRECEGLRSRIADLESVEEFDPELFMEYLSQVADVEDSVLLEAFVWQVQLTTDKVTVVLNYDVRESEPARIEFGTGSQDSSWLPGLGYVRTGKGTYVGVYAGKMALSFDRAA